jgi:pyruvyltransferase
MLRVGDQPVYYVIGSILQRITDPNAVVWGSGFIDSQSSLKVKPRRVCAVRGPLTREKLLGLGIDCPSVYGDPALLYPRYYRPASTKTFALGIVPHIRDQASPLLDRLRVHPSVIMIDITSGIDEVVDRVNQCRMIASSSLHGLIIADAYGIPSSWIRISSSMKGDGFKFRDYLASVGRDRFASPLQLTPGTTVDDIGERAMDAVIDIDMDALVEACPFRESA